MGLGCGEEVKEKDSFPKISDNIIFFFKLPVNVATNMEVGEGNLGTKKGVNTKCTKPILFFTLMTDSQISYSWDLKTILFANGFPKTQVSQNVKKSLNSNSEKKKIAIVLFLLLFFNRLWRLIPINILVPSTLQPNLDEFIVLCL